MGVVEGMTKLTTGNSLPAKLAGKVVGELLCNYYSRKVWHNLFSFRACRSRAVAFVSLYLYCLLCTFELWQRFAFSILLSLSLPLHCLSRSERVSYLSLHSSCCYYMHCVLKLNSGLIVMNVRLCLQVLLMDLLRVATAHTILYIHSFISAFKFSEGKGKQCWVSNLKLAWLNCLAQSQLSLELRLFSLMAL